MNKPENAPGGVFAEFGLVIRPESDDLVGQAPVLPGMLIPGTGILRMSVLVTWADMLFGLIAMRGIAPKIPVTLALDIHLFKPVTGIEQIHMRGCLTKAGKSVMIFTIDFHSEDGEHLGFGHSMFMATPDPNLQIPTGDWAERRFARQRGPLLQVPLAERLNCARLAPGVASLPRAGDVLNQTGAINGGILVVPVEEAVLSSLQPGSSMASLELRYLRPVRKGPAVARALLEKDLGRIEVVDEDRDTLAMVATTRVFPA